MITRYKRGNCVRLNATVRDADNALHDPDTSIKVTVKSAGTAYLTAQSMTKVTTGVYYYDWQTDGDDALGIYSMEVTSVDGSKTVVTEDNSAFELYA